MPDTPSTAPSAGRVLVTGGAGFIGSHTVERLLNDGRSVVVIDDLSSGRRENLAHLADDPRLELVVADVAAPSLPGLLDDLIVRHGRFDAIIHLAAQVSVVVSFDAPLEDLRVNCAGAVQLLEYARHNGLPRVVFASSAAVYGDTSEVPTQETAQPAPMSPYGIHKRAAEMHLAYYRHVHGVPTTSLRFFNVYGPRQDPSSPYSGVISIFMDRALRHAALSVHGGGAQTRDFVYVGDVADALARAAYADDAPGPYNIGSEHETSIATLARKVVEVTQSRSVISVGPARPGELTRSCAATDRARQALSWRPTVDLATGLARTAEWLSRS